MKQYQIFRNGIILIIILLSSLYLYESFVFKISETKHMNNMSIEEEIKKQEQNKKVKTLVDTLWCENRQSRKSMKLVLSVIYNRAKEKTLEGLYTEVIKPYQFSCLNDEEIINKQTKAKKDLEMYTVAEEIVFNFIKGNFKPLVNAKFYYAADKISKPKYLEDKELLVAFEGHHFY